MTYHLTVPQPTPPWPLYGLAGLGATGQGVSSACQAWIGATYDVAEFERIRTQELPQLLAEAPKPPYLPNPPIGQPLPWSAFGYAGAMPVGLPADAPVRDVRLRGLEGWLWGLGSTGTMTGSRGSAAERAAAGLQRRTYDRYLTDTLHWVNRVVGAFNRMALCLNMPSYWLLPTSNARMSTRFGDWVLLDQAEPAPVMINSYGRRTGTAALRSGALCPNPPTALNWRNLPVSLLHASKKLRDSSWYGVSREALVDFWKSFQYDNRPQAIPARRSGFPTNARGADGSIAIPPAAVTVVEHGSWLSASAEYTDCRMWAGPVFTVWTAEQYLRTIASRSAVTVLGNAFASYGDVLYAWADSPNSKFKADGKTKLKVAAAGLKTAGAAMTGAGTVSGAFPVVIMGTVLTALSSVAGILPAAVGTLSSCTGEDGKDAPARIYLHRSLGFCGPPPPLLENPPEGCSPSDILETVHKAGSRDESLWDKALPYLTHPVTLTVVGLAAAYGVYRVVAPKAK